MQMDAEFKEEQIGTPFVWVGALEGGFGGVPQGRPPQKVNVPSPPIQTSWHVYKKSRQKDPVGGLQKIL